MEEVTEDGKEFSETAVATREPKGAWAAAGAKGTNLDSRDAAAAEETGVKEMTDSKDAAAAVEIGVRGTSPDSNGAAAAVIGVRETNPGSKGAAAAAGETGVKEKTDSKGAAEVAVEIATSGMLP